MKSGAIDAAFLIWDRWDDYNFRTQFDLQLRDGAGELHDIGVVKIASFGMGPRNLTVDHRLNLTDSTAVTSRSVKMIPITRT